MEGEQPGLSLAGLGGATLAVCGTLVGVKAALLCGRDLRVTILLTLIKGGGLVGQAGGA